MTTTTKSPRTVGPNLAAMTIRERAARDWEDRKQTDRLAAERKAKNLAQKIFGITPEFVDYVPETFATRKKYLPRHLVCFEIEGLVFNYRAATDDYDESFVLVDRCTHCDDGIALQSVIRQLSDLARTFEYDREILDDPKCSECHDREKAATAPSEPDATIQPG